MTYHDLCEAVERVLDAKTGDQDDADRAAFVKSDPRLDDAFRAWQVERVAAQVKAEWEAMNS